MTTGDNGIQMSAGAVLRNNIVVGASGGGIYVAANQLQNNFHDIQILQNTVYNSGSVDLYFPVRQKPSA